MDRKNIIIFIDSLPHFYISNMKFLSGFKNDIAKVTPGFGYSINVKAEIFGGYTPDDLGCFNEWTYDPGSDLRKYRYFFQPLRLLKRFYYPDRIAHKLFSKFYGHNVLNIPFEYLSFFQKKGTEPYRGSFHLPTIFSEMKNHKKVCYFHFSYGSNRDSLIFEETLKTISCGEYDNIFVASGDLDGIAHSFGVGSEEYDKKIEELDRYLSQVYEACQGSYNNIVILSDHGMANVHEGVDVNMEKEFGRAGEDTYLYFVDSTMLRVWTFDAKKKVEIENYLDKLDFGRVLNEEVRVKYRITLESFGNIIFLLNEGVVFNPGFFGRKMPKAMHGYNPELESQSGICLCLDRKDSPAKLASSFTAIELYEFLNNWANISS